MIRRPMFYFVRLPGNFSDRRDTNRRAKGLIKMLAIADSFIGIDAKVLRRGKSRPMRLQREITFTFGFAKKKKKK